MKSIVIEKPNTLTIETRALPQPAPGEVRIKVKLAGICGSDSHIYRGHNPFAKYPRVIGHEFFGVRRQRQSRPDRRTGIRRSGDQLRALLPLFSR